MTTNPGQVAAEWAAACDAADHATPTQRYEALVNELATTAALIERADLLPTNHEVVTDPEAWQVRIYALEHVFAVTALHGTRGPHYLVTDYFEASDPDDGRFTSDLGTIRAWFLNWAATTTLRQRDGLL